MDPVHKRSLIKLQKFLMENLELCELIDELKTNEIITANQEEVINASNLVIPSSCKSVMSWPHIHMFLFFIMKNKGSPIFKLARYQVSIDIWTF